MKPISFKGQNVVFGEGQKEYLPLPALRLADGQVITCWEFTEEEILEIIESRCIYINQLTFNQPLQPLLPVVDLSDGLGLIYEDPS